MRSLLLFSVVLIAAARPARVITSFTLSPDGTQLCVSYHGDLWIVAATGGEARRLTQGPAEDTRPAWSPDGKRIAFLSDRGADGTRIWTVAASGGRPVQLSFDSRRQYPLDWTPDSKAVLALVPGLSPFRGMQVVAIDTTARHHPHRLFKAFARNGRLSPDGSKLLFTRSGRPTTRKGYAGSAAAQLWLADLTQNPVTFARLSPDAPDAMNRSYAAVGWIGNGEVVYVAEKGRARNLYRRELGTGKDRAITSYGEAEGSSDDGVLLARLARNGSCVVYYRGFDLWRKDLASTAPAEKLAIECPDDADLRNERVSAKTASAVAFTQDGKQMAFVAASDLWVMDRVLKEPRRVTASIEEEREPLFSKAGDKLFFCSDREGSEPDIWVAERADAKQSWFLQKSFKLTRLTHDARDEANLALSPDGTRLSYVRDGELVHCKLDGSDVVVVDTSWDPVEYDWSPDGAYLVISRNDPDFNTDVWITRSNGEGRVANLSRHPDRDRDPVWSPGGGRIAWIGRRLGGEWDIYYANLDPKLDEETERDRKLAKAKQALAKKPKKPKKKDSKRAAPDKTKTVLVLEDLHDRVHRVRIPGNETGLLWSADGKKLTFEATIGGKKGRHAIELTGRIKPVFEFASSLRSPVRSGKELVGLANGVPAAQSATGKTTTFGFEARLTRDLAAWRVAVFRQAWRTMRESFYDPALNHRDWNAIGDRYARVAADCLWPDQMDWLVNQMLGELNGSHLGFRRAAPPRNAAKKATAPWNVTTWQLGVAFDRAARGPGLRVAHAFYKGPARRTRSRLRRGDRILAINGTQVGATADLTAVLNNDKPDPVELSVQDPNGKTRTVTIEPISPSAMSRLLYDDWVRATRRRVEQASGGRLGYAHIRGMNMSSFAKLEADLYAAGAGKEGLLIDVRWNGGGSTADHVLTMLFQPAHAHTLPRGATESGYPQDRRIYASWTKPIVLLCNERSFSNAEILSHAVKQLGRGKVVGERTAGGVISTGGTRLMDGSTLRLPFRGWFVLDGTDMELNGCMPDIRVALTPADEEAGRDPQIAAAIDACRAACDAAKRRPKPKLIRRSERKR